MSASEQRQGRQPAQPLARLVHYQYIEELVVGRRVLEIGCQGGRGARLLARRARVVVALDLALDGLAAARGDAGRKNLCFVVGEPQCLHYRAGSFDVVAVPELQRWGERAQLIAEVKRVLRRKGIALFAACSADHGGSSGVLYEDLIACVSASFAHVRMFGDIPFVGRIMAAFDPEQEVDPALDCSLVQEDEAPTHYVAMCSNAPLPSLAYTVLQVPIDTSSSPDVDREIAELEALRQGDLWRLDELAGRFEETKAELAKAAAPASDDDDGDYERVDLRE